MLKHLRHKIFKTKNVHPILSWLTLLGVIVSYVNCGVSIYSMFYYIKCMESSTQEEFQNDKSTKLHIWKLDTSFIETSSDSYLNLNVFDDQNTIDADCIPVGEVPVRKTGVLLYNGTSLLRGKVFMCSRQSVQKFIF